MAHPSPSAAKPSTPSWRAISAPRWIPQSIASLPGFNPCRGSSGRRSPAHPLRTPARHRRATSVRTRPTKPRNPRAATAAHTIANMLISPQAVSQRDTILVETSQCGVSTYVLVRLKSVSLPALRFRV